MRPRGVRERIYEQRQRAACAVPAAAMVLGADWEAFAREQEAWPAAHCAAYRASSVAHYLLIFRDFPTLISIVLLLAQYYQPFRDVYYPMAISSGLLGSLLVGYLLRWLVEQPGPSAGCGTPWEMPNAASQQATFIATILVTFGVLWRPRLGTYQQQFAWSLVYYTLLARVYLGYNTFAQVLAGASLGAAWAVVWQSLVYNVLCWSARYDHLIFNVWIFRQLRYTNGWCTETHMPVPRATEKERARCWGQVESLLMALLNLPAVVVPPGPDVPARRPADEEANAPVAVLTGIEPIGASVQQQLMPRAMAVEATLRRRLRETPLDEEGVVSEVLAAAALPAPPWMPRPPLRVSGGLVVRE